MSNSAFYKWRSKYGGMHASMDEIGFAPFAQGDAIKPGFGLSNLITSSLEWPVRQTIFWPNAALAKRQGLIRATGGKHERPINHTFGWHHSVKTNYVGRLWHALASKACGLIAAEQLLEIGLVLDTAEHLFQGIFAPRSEYADERRDFEVSVCSPDGVGRASIKISNISGELWQNAVRDSEIASDWMDELDNAHGAILFVRVGSDLDVRPLDWVTAKSLLAMIGNGENLGKQRFPAFPLS